MRIPDARAALGLVAALTLALLPAACGGRDDPEPAGDAGSSGAFPVTIEHKYGSTAIESEPERVVTVGYTEQDIVLALGIKPVGVRRFLGGYDWRERPWAQSALGDSRPPVVGAEEINFEQVAVQRPDLIVGVNSGMSQDDYDKLSQIAPTVPQSDRHIDFGVPWREQTLVTGRALGRGAEARRLVSEIEGSFAGALEANPEFEGKTAVVGYASASTFGAHATQDYRVRFFEDLGFVTPKEIDRLAGDSFFVDFSQEQVRLLDQDVLIMFADEDTAMKNGLFRRLDVVREGRVVYVDLPDQFAGALGFSSPLSLPFAVEEVTPALAAAVDGDPATEVEQPQ